MVEQPHPDIEIDRGELVGAVEAAENKGILGQAIGFPAFRFGDWAEAVVGLVAVWQQGEPLGVEQAVLRRHHHRVGDQPVDERDAAGAWIAKEARLHRRRPQGEDAGPHALGVALEVDEDVDAVGADALGGGLVGEGADGDEVIQSRQQAAAHRAVVVGTAGIGEEFEPRAVVAFEQLGDKIGGGVLVVVCGEVAEAQPAGRAGRRRRQLVGGRAQMLGSPGAAGGKLIGRGGGEGEDDEGGDIGRAPPDRRQQPLFKVCQAVPLAVLAELVDEEGEDFPVVRIDGESLAVDADRLFHLASALEGLAEGLEGGEVAGGLAQRVAERARGEIGPAEGAQRLAKPKQHAGVIGPEAQRLEEKTDRGFRPALVVESEAEIGEGVGVDIAGGG